jgi:hypothetical protein
MLRTICHVAPVAGRHQGCQSVSMLAGARVAGRMI